MRLARTDERLKAEERTRIAEAYAVRAVELLRKAQAANEALPPIILREYERLSPIRDRADFKALLEKKDSPR